MSDPARRVCCIAFCSKLTTLSAAGHTLKHPNSCFSTRQVPEAFSYLAKEDTVAYEDAGQVIHEAAKSSGSPKEKATTTSEEDTVSTVLDVRYDISVSAAEGGRNGGRGMRGIYMREAHETTKPSSFSCSVTPRLHEVGLSGIRGTPAFCYFEPDFKNVITQTCNS